MGVDDNWPPDSSLQLSTHPSFWFGNKSQNRKNAAATAVCMCSRDDDDSDSSLAHSSEMGQSYGTCGRGTSRQDSASQQQDLSKELMFQGIVAVQNVSEVVWDDINDPVPDEVRKEFQEVGEQLKTSFSKNSPGNLEYIVIISDIAQVNYDVHRNHTTRQKQPWNKK